MNDYRNRARAHVRMLWTMSIVLAIEFAVFVHAKQADATTLQPAYVLDHPIDPDKLIIATQDGRYPFVPLALSDCSWLHSDMDVDVAPSQDSRAWLLSSGAGMCTILVDGRVDATPCLTDDAGNCKVDEEHHWT
jgi:hypothetical protein